MLLFGRTIMNELSGSLSVCLWSTIIVGVRCVGVGLFWACSKRSEQKKFRSGMCQETVMLKSWRSIRRYLSHLSWPKWTLGEWWWWFTTRPARLSLPPTTLLCLSVNICKVVVPNCKVQPKYKQIDQQHMQERDRQMDLFFFCQESFNFLVWTKV